MTPPSCLRTLLGSAALLAIAASALAPATARAEEGPPGEVDAFLVIGQRENRVSKGATGLAMSVAETPQSVTVIDKDYIAAFGLDEVNQVLTFTTGINVEAVETNRTYYNARGFDIKSMQVDGLGLPFFWNVAGALDTYGYEKVEVIRGANGLLTGTGNPSGTINYVRKRPTNALEGEVGVTVGSENRRRFEADLSGPLTASGSWAGRIIVAREAKDSFLESNQNDRLFASAIIEGQIGDRAIVTLGHTYQRSESDGVLWGAPPLHYGDGSLTRYDRSATTTMDWTYWDNSTASTFAELVYALPGDWQARGVIAHNDYKETTELFYTYGVPDKATGLGLFGYPGHYKPSTRSDIVDVTLSGPLQLFGREHELLTGLSHAESNDLYLQAAAPATDPAWGALPAFPGWDGTEIGRPAFGAFTEAGRWTNTVRRAYLAGRFQISDPLKVILGVNAIDIRRRGINFGESMDLDENAVSPYLGATYTTPAGYILYGSYSDIFEPQPELTEKLAPLGAAKGKSYEIGIRKTWYDGRLLASLALFKASQDNFAEFAGRNTTLNIDYYKGISTEVEGFELEVSGKINQELKLQGGFTSLELTGQGGVDIRTYVPRQTFNLSGLYRPTALPRLEMGAAIKWQTDTYAMAALGRVDLEAFSLINLSASYDLTDKVEAAFNISNAGDIKNRTSLYWANFGQGFYGPPRAVSVSLKYAF